MKRCKIGIACFLLAVYLPMWLLASFHVHFNPLENKGLSEERQTTELEGDDCLLCQFQHLVYEDTPQVSIAVILPEILVNILSFSADEQEVFGTCFLSRAPPVLL